ncbi:DUF3048 domain-containing protein [Melghirimyces algeriensis]|nr:DUF3048 domain-containing protein [Melghirimyces algeriensis]
MKKGASEKETSGKSAVANHPLTGEPLEQTDPGPVFMVMVNNHPDARPQTGLDQADMVVEALTEGEITRFAAFYYGHQQGIVGPVRSIRPYYLDLREGPQAVVGHAGGSPQALKRMDEQNIPSLDGIHEAGAYFQRKDFRKPPHNLYTDLSQLRQGVIQEGIDAKKRVNSPYVFDSETPKSGEKLAFHIRIAYHRLYEVGYQYNQANGSYIRYTQGEKQLDGKTKHPLSMKNVLVIRTSHRVIDSSGRREIDLTGSGKGMLFRDGKAISIQWENRNGWIVPVRDGEIAPFHPGKTWIHVIPENGNLAYGKG